VAKSGEEYKRKLEAYEAEEKAKGDLFDPKALVESAKTIRTVNDPELGVIKFGVLTMKDLLDLNKVQDDQKKSIVMLHMMLVKAYPDLTVEDIEKMPAAESARLIAILTKQSGFLKPAR